VVYICMGYYDFEECGYVGIHMVLVYVGTSGWSYFWNRDGSLKWYIANTRFNAVELNMSFYRFPFPSLPKHWARIGSNLAWAIKVNRIITHRMRFSERAINTWEKFRGLFRPMEERGLIHFYLFQCPPYLKPTPRNVENIERFVDATGLGEEFAIEFRNDEWFKPKWERWARKLGITMVSVDAPEFQNKIYCSSRRIYVRIHGRETWYHHIYSREEVVELLENVAKKMRGVDAVYFFLNNNHGMLPTGNMIIDIVEEQINGASYMQRESRMSLRALKA